MSETTQKHYRDDFSAVLTLTDGRGDDIGIPDYPWEARFWTYGPSQSFVASWDGQTRTNWMEQDGRIVVLFNDHGLGPGPLRCEFVCHLPSADYPDGEQRMVVSIDPGITLTSCRCASVPSSAQVEAILPYIKGDKGDKGEPGEPGGAGSCSCPPDADEGDIRQSADAVFGAAQGADDEPEATEQDINQAAQAVFR